MGIAAGLCSFFRSVGQSLGIVIGDALFQNQMKKKLSQDPELAGKVLEYAKNALSLAEAIKEMASGSSTRVYIVDSYVHALKVLWWTMLAIGAAAGLLSLLTKGLTLDRAPSRAQPQKAEEPVDVESKGSDKESCAEKA